MAKTVKIALVALALLLAVALVAQLEIRETEEIAASPDDLWRALTDFEAYPAWNPFIRRITGEARRVTAKRALLRRNTTLYRGGSPRGTENPPSYNTRPARRDSRPA